MLKLSGYLGVGYAYGYAIRIRETLQIQQNDRVKNKYETKFWSNSLIYQSVYVILWRQTLFALSVNFQILLDWKYLYSLLTNTTVVPSHKNVFPFIWNYLCQMFIQNIDFH